MNAEEIGFLVIVGVVIAFYVIVLRPQPQEPLTAR